MRTGQVLVGLAAVALLAGVAFSVGIPSDGTGPDDGAPTTSTPEARAYPPGVDEGGIANVSRLLAAHRSSLASAGFVVVTEHTYRSSDSAANVTVRQEIAASRNVESASVRRVRRGEATERSVVELWSNGSTGLARYDEAGSQPTVQGATYARDEAGDTGIARLAPLLERAEFDLASVTRDRGQRHYTLRATGYDRSSWPRGEPDEVGVSMRVVIAEDGRIRTIQSSVNRIRATDDGRRWVLEVFTYRLVRTDVERLGPPDWASTDGNRTATGDDP